MRIGMFGLRGLRPDLEVTGFETAFAEIAPRLVARGHAVTIYCRAGAHSANNRPARTDGVELRYMPSPGGKNLSAVSSTLLAVLHALPRQSFDVWFFVNVGMGHHCVLARLSRRPVVLSVDGLDWQRGKWGPVARRYFHSAARSAVRWCDALVTDAEGMRVFYRDHFGRDSTMIRYGADIARSERPEALEPFGVEPRQYYLIVSRLIPENSLDVVLDGFSRSRTARRLLVVGGSNYRNRFHDRLVAIACADERIRLLGPVNDQSVLTELWCNCYAYLHGHSVGGTNPALLRAMGCGACVLALDTEFNRESLADTGRFFARDAASVATVLDQVDADQAAVARLRTCATERARECYRWDHVVDEYERLFTDVTRSRV